MPIFEQAARAKIRFASIRGDLTVEQLFDLPLKSKSGFDLDSVARQAHGELKASEEESFVDESRTSVAQKQNELKMAVVKHVIEVKKQERDAAAKRLANAEERQRLLAILGDKETDELKGLTKEELKNRIAALN